MSFVPPGTMLTSLTYQCSENVEEVEFSFGTHPGGADYHFVRWDGPCSAVYGMACRVRPTGGSMTITGVFSP